MKLVTTKFKSGVLHEKHAVATWNLGNHLSINDDNDYDDDDVDGGGGGGYVIRNSMSLMYKCWRINILHPCSRDNLEQLENKVLNGWDIEQINQFSILSFRNV